MKGKFMFLAEGFEQTEALACLDVLHRGGIEVKTVSISNNIYVTSSHGLIVKADVLLADLVQSVDCTSTDSGDVMIFPGGMPGTKNLAANTELINLMNVHFSKGGLVAAICAAPGLVVSQLNKVEGKQFTCFEGFQTPMIDKGACYISKPVVVDDNLITARGAGWAIEFGLNILKYLSSKEIVASVKKGMMLD